MTDMNPGIICLGSFVGVSGCYQWPRGCCVSYEWPFRKGPSVPWPLLQNNVCAVADTLGKEKESFISNDYK